VTSLDQSLASGCHSSDQLFPEHDLRLQGLQKQTQSASLSKVTHPKKNLVFPLQGFHFIKAGSKFLRRGQRDFLIEPHDLLVDVSQQLVQRLRVVKILFPDLQGVLKSCEPTKFFV
jgi:hypothetical protein